jgi:monoamine oxidase
LRASRRQFLAVLGQVGGAAAVQGALSALGLGEAHAIEAFAPQRSERAHGRKVLVLGGGIAGMTAAYELRKLGYSVTLLEAADRPGGRCFSIRRGTRVTDTDGDTQTCDFDSGLYYNCGPARIPGFHVTLDYCRELGVPVEMMVNRNPNAWDYTTKGPLAGKRLRQKEVEGDQDGYVAELLSKAVSANALDAELGEQDRANLLDYLSSFGWLEKGGHYAGTARSRGYAVYPGAAEAEGEVGKPLDRSALLARELGFRHFFLRSPMQQPGMLQIVGGTDQLAHAFARKLGPSLLLSAPVRELRQDESGVRVVYGVQGKQREARAEYAVCALPLTTLREVATDFSPELRTVIASMKYEMAGKAGLQFGRRFWEEDDRIFGGNSSTDQTITQIMYPSTGMLGKKGVLVGYYVFRTQALELQAMRHPQRLETALSQGEKLHPPYRRHLESSFSMAWGKMPWLHGSWAAWNEDGPRPAEYALLCKPAGRVHFAGDAMSQQTGWMAGAIESARRAVLAIHARASAESSVTSPEVKP